MERRIPGVVESVVNWSRVGFWSTVLPTFALTRGLLTKVSPHKEHEIMVYWAKCCVRTAGVSVRVHGTEHVPRDRPLILFSSHSSISDICILGEAVPVEFKWLARKEIFKVPFIGWYIEQTGHLKIDRGNRPEAIRLLREAAQRIRQGTNVLVFPEGTRSPDGRLQPFKKGVFHLAIEAQVGALPIRVLGSERVAPRGTLRLGAADVDVIFRPPIETAGMTTEDLPQLMEMMRNELLEAERSLGRG